MKMSFRKLQLMSENDALRRMLMSRKKAFLKSMERQNEKEKTESLSNLYL